MVNWQDHITTNPEVLLGKPIISGTRISVEFILERLASGWSADQLYENYPRLTSNDLMAVYSYTYECMKDGLLITDKLHAADMFTVIDDNKIRQRKF